ncbi:hypothetical protein BLIC30S_02517 [Bacillus licheniformis]
MPVLRSLKRAKSCSRFEKEFFEDFSYKEREETKTRTFRKYVKAVRKVLQDRC